ncbi:GntR family transcriptional regulator of vanillate catabolism [Sphingomonas sp. UYEF23]
MNTIKEMILSGALKPGERVTEAGLAEQLAVSRTPVRNIMPRLAAEGYLEAVGRRGYRIKTFGESESLEALDLRALLEGHAARMVASAGASTAVLTELDACLAFGDRLFEKRSLDREDEHQYGVMNGRFHKIVIDACGSPTLQAFIERLNRVPFVAPSVILFDRIGLDRAFDLLFRAHGVHHAIVEAIRQGDGHRAEALFREHAHQQRISMFSRRPAMGGNAGRPARARAKRPSASDQPAAPE